MSGNPTALGVQHDPLVPDPPPSLPYLSIRQLFELLRDECLTGQVTLHVHRGKVRLADLPSGRYGVTPA